MCDKIIALIVHVSYRWPGRRAGVISSREMPETMSDDYLNVPVQSGFLSQDDINAPAITRARFMRSQLKVATAEDVKLVEFPNIYQDINVASRHAKLPKFKLETIFTATSLWGKGGRYPFLITRKASCIFMCFFFRRRFKQGGERGVRRGVNFFIRVLIS